LKKLEMSTPDFPFSRRYNSLRLLGFDYSSPLALYSITLKTDLSRPVFGDLTLAKRALTVLLDDRTLARIRLCAYTLLPDHLHMLAGLGESGKSLSTALGAFESLTTQLYWKRSREIIETGIVICPPKSVEKSQRDEARQLMRALIEGRIKLRPEALELKNWPKVRPEHFLGKQLWQRSFHDHVIRNEADFRETVEYMMLNPVRRGYVSKPEYYPFSGVTGPTVEV
jgi:REP element-mobilizing transposase RayT